jgi:hypothetical protein
MRWNLSGKPKTKIGTEKYTHPYAWFPTRMDDGVWVWLESYGRRYVYGISRNGESDALRGCPYFEWHLHETYTLSI